MVRKIGGKCRLGKKSIKNICVYCGFNYGIFFFVGIGGGSFEILWFNLKILFCFKLL